MSLFTRRHEAPVEERSDFRWPPAGLYGVPTDAGVPVDAQNALRSMAVLACVRLLKTAVANLPVHAVRHVGDSRQRVPNVPQVVRRPSGSVSRRVWVAQMMDSLLTSGNAYGLAVAFDGQARPTQVETVSPADVRWQPDGNGSHVPHLKGVPQSVWPEGNFIHIPASAFVRAGRAYADSPVDLAKQAIGAGLAAESFGARFFRDGATPTAVVKADMELSPEEAEAIKATVRRTMSGSREPAVMDSRLTLEKWSIDPSDSQFIDLIRFEVEQACRAYGVPPTMVYAAISGQNVTYSNANQQDLHFLKFSLESWLLDLEDAWSAWLTAPVVVKFNVDAILRMDASARWSIHDLRLKNKTTTVNQVRALEDEPPFSDPAYDEPGVPGGASAVGGDDAPSAD